MVLRGGREGRSVVANRVYRGCEHKKVTANKGDHENNTKPLGGIGQISLRHNHNPTIPSRLEINNERS